MIRQFLTVAVVAGAVIVAGCNTVAGAGKDVSSAGQAVTKSADKNK